MIEKSISVGASLEARPAAFFVQTAGRFASDIKIQVDNQTVNAKSIMGIISLGVLDGHQATIIAEGEDEEAAVAELVRILSMP